jgi:signal transduction histidine kinase
VIGQVKGVTDAIAHDLRTPLTRVRAQLSRLSREPGAPHEIGAAIDDLDLVLERFAALLRISELEASGRRQGFGPVDLRALAASVHALYEPLAEDRGVALTLATDADRTIEADEQLLFEAVSNLVDNAIKFTPPGGAVAIAVRSGTVGSAIEVRDDGPGIAADERTAVLRRFHRGSAAALAPGSGLGLSVVAAIVHLHGFTLDLEDAAPGLRATIRILGA